MNRLTESIGTAVFTVFFAYTLAYFITLYLPTSGLVSLGILSTQEGVLEGFSADLDVPSSYLDALFRVTTLEFGLTQDKRPVLIEMGMALRETLPIFAFCILFQILVLRVSILALPKETDTQITGLKFLAFVPAYLLPLVGFLTIAGLEQESLLTTKWAQTLMITAVSVIPTSAFLISVVHSMLMDVTKEKHYEVLGAYGFSEKRKRKRIVPNLLFALLPGFHKIISAQLAVLMFTESIFGNSGFGAQLFFAFRRTDINMILASILFISAFIAMARLVTVLLDMAMFGDACEL